MMQLNLILGVLVLSNAFTATLATSEAVTRRDKNKSGKK